MFQPRVKLEFVRRYCPPDKGWKVFVDIDPAEEGRAGGGHKKPEAIERQKLMLSDASKVRDEFRQLGVTVGGCRADWYYLNRLPKLEGDRDIVAFHPERRLCIIAEAEGISSSQPEQKLYKAIGQIVMAVSNCSLINWKQTFVLVVHGEDISRHLKQATALEKIGVAAVSLNPDCERDKWLFGSPVLQEEPV
jgi:hypothetical protein